MSSVLRSVRKRKKGRTVGAVDIIDRAEYAELEVDAKVELIRSLVPLGLMHIEELLDEEVTALAGERYARKDPAVALTNAEVAQSVEHMTENHGVGSSILPLGTTYSFVH